MEKNKYLKKFEAFISAKTKKDNIFSEFQCFTIHSFNEIYIVDIYSSKILEEKNFSGYVNDLDTFPWHLIKEFRFTANDICEAEKIAQKYGCRIVFLS